MLNKIYRNAREKSVGPALAAVLPVASKPWYRKPELLYLNFCVASLFLLSSSNGYDGSMMNGLQSLPPWQKFMDHPVGAWLGFINSSQFLGGLLWLPPVAWLSNRIGRKWTIYTGYIWLFVGVGLQTGARNEGEFVAGRAIIGLATAHYSGCVPILMSEIAYPTHRGIITCLFLSGWYVGSFLAAWATYGTRTYNNDWSWRIPSLLQVAVPIAALPGLLMCPESPRYHVSKNNIDKARSFLVRFHAEGVHQSPLAAFELAEISTTIMLEHEVKETTSYLDMLKTPGNRHRTFICVFLGVFAHWCGQNIVSYYLAPVLITIGVTSVTAQTMISGFLQIWNLIWALTGSFCVDLVGRRALFLGSCAGMLVSYILVTALSAEFAKRGSAGIGIAVIPFLFLNYGFYSLAYTPLVVAYPVEIWPYKYRSRGLGIELITAYCAAFLNVFVNPIALENIGWKYYLVFVFILAGGGVVMYFTFPETRGHTLEDMAEIFDGPDAAVAEGNKAVQDDVDQARSKGPVGGTKAASTHHLETV
ncbi:hypothetical protein BDV06DRAFT_232793 [Aspergillus oleicola]